MQTFEQHMEGFEARALAFREAVNDADIDAIDGAAGALTDYIWNPSRSVFVRLAVFELSRAMTESQDRVIRVVIQNHQAYALEALAEGVLDLQNHYGRGGDGGGGEARDAADVGNDNASELAPASVVKADQQAA